MEEGDTQDPGDSDTGQSLVPRFLQPTGGRDVLSENKGNESPNEQE